LLPSNDLECIANNMMLLSRVIVNCEMLPHSCCLQNWNISERHINISSGFCEKKLYSGQGYISLFICNLYFVLVILLLNVVEYEKVHIVANTEECLHT
jgi:hypothetical protein